MLIIEQKISFLAINTKMFYVITRLMVQVKHGQSKKKYIGISEKQTTRNNKIILIYHQINGSQRFPTHILGSEIGTVFFQLC